MKKTQEKFRLLYIFIFLILIYLSRPKDSVFFYVDYFKYLIGLFSIFLLFILWIYIYFSKSALRKLNRRINKPLIFDSFNIILLFFIVIFLRILISEKTILILMFLIVSGFSLFLPVLSFILITEDTKRTIKSIGVLIISLYLGLICVEILFRTIFLENKVPQNEKEFNKIIKSRWKKNITGKKHNNILRIAGVADSFGLAGGDKNYYNLLEQRLTEKGIQSEVLNFSIGGIELEDEYFLIKNFVIKYNPDVIVHSIFIGNDFFPTKGYLVKFKNIPLRKYYGAKSYNPFLPYNYLFLKWLYRYLSTLKSQQNKSHEIKKLHNKIETFSEKDYLYIERKRLEICKKGKETEKKFQAAEKVLDKIYNLTKRKNIKYFILIHPDEFQVNKELLNKIYKRFNLNPNDYDLELPQKFLIKYCEKKNIIYQDILPHFRNQHQNLYLLNDSHYNEKGNSITAGLLVNFF